MNKKSIIITISLIGVLLLLFIIYKASYKEIKTLTYDNISTTIEEEVYTVIYFGEESKSISNNLKDLVQDEEIEIYYSNASLEDLNKILKKNNLEAKSLNKYVLFMEGVPYKVLDKKEDYLKIKEQMNKYFYGIIPDDEIAYKVPNDADYLIKRINKNDYTVMVIGEETCHYCDLYKNVFNEVAADNKLDIYYIDAITYNQEEYKKIQALDYEIPARCTKTGKDTTLSGVIPKPITIITKKGKFVDCIRGYVGKDILMDKLKEYNIVKE